MDEGWVGRNAAEFLPCRKLLKTVGFEGVPRMRDDSALEEAFAGIYFLTGDSNSYIK